MASSMLGTRCECRHNTGKIPLWIKFRMSIKIVQCGIDLLISVSIELTILMKSFLSKFSIEKSELLSVTESNSVFISSIHVNTKCWQ
jgi:hypothetical protein